MLARHRAILRTRLERRAFAEFRWKGESVGFARTQPTLHSAYPKGLVEKWVGSLHFGTASPVQRVLWCGRAAPLEVEAPSVRGTLTPNPAPIEADLRGIVYRVSHVVDGKFADLLRRNHSNHYHVATHCYAIVQRLKILAADHD